VPQFLTRSAVRLLEASVDSLSLAIFAASIPRRHGYKSDAEGAVVIGMAATAAEQAMASILVQVDGDEAILRQTGKFKTAAEILNNVRRILTSVPVARATYLTAGVQDPAAHRQSLLDATESFLILVTQRAAALHGGQGMERSAAVHVIRNVHRFIQLLGESSRIRPYLTSLPELHEPESDSFVVMDELARRFERAGSIQQKGALVRHLFLVLPELPPDPPEWIGAFDRISVMPTDNDIRLLVATLQQAQPVRLARLSSAGRPIAVRVTGGPEALPIAPQALRTSFTSIADQIGGDIANANGRLDLGILDLPPDRLTTTMMALGDRQLGEDFGGWPLTPHRAWPFIAAAIAGQGTPRPYWFLVKKVEDLPQLKARLIAAAAAGGRPLLTQRVNTEVIPGIDSIRNATQLPRNNPLRSECESRYRDALSRNSGLRDAVARQVSDGKLDQVSAEAIGEFETGLGSAIECWSAVEAFASSRGDARQAIRRYWARKIAEVVTEPNDVPFLTAVLSDPELVQAGTAARKALRMIDAMTHGPSMEVN
jgi:hypothetical protein